LDAVATPALRERKKAATYATLREAALTLCTDDGLDALTIDAICLRANVSRRTFFNYFPERDDAIISWSPQDHTELVEMILGRPRTEDPLTAVEAALVDFVDTATTTPLWRARIELLRRHPRLRERFSSMSRRMETSVADAVAQRTGRSQSDVVVTMLAAAALAAVRTTLTLWFSNPTADVRELLHDHLEVLRTGFAASSFATGANAGGRHRPA
jgi:AcrR family transcriptional regulator